VLKTLPQSENTKKGLEYLEKIKSDTSVMELPRNVYQWVIQKEQLKRACKVSITKLPFYFKFPTIRVFPKNVT